MFGRFHMIDDEHYFINVSPFFKNIFAINICIERKMFGLRDYDLMISQFGGHR